MFAIYRPIVLAAATLPALASCGEPLSNSRESGVAAPAEHRQSERPSRQPESVSLPLVIFLGDSLTAGFGVGEELAFPARVGERLAERGWSIRLVNAGVSGDTTAAGVSRLDWLLAQQPDIVVLALGANDGLRGLSLAETERNLESIVERSRASGAEVLLVGMKLPPSYGAQYTDGFESLYPRLAERLGVDLVPFLLEGVAAVPELNLADGIHPNAPGHEALARTVAPYVERILERL